jgi:hypothetical protein
MSKLLILAAALASASAGLFVENPTALKAAWDEFKTTHNKSYAGTEDEHRFGK